MIDDMIKYVRNNFHRLSSWNKANVILSGLKAGETSVILLTGETGSGREYFSKALTYNFRYLNSGNAMFAPLDVSDASQKEAVSEFQNFLKHHGENYTLKAKLATPGFLGFSIELLRELKINPVLFFRDCAPDIPEDDLYTRIIQLVSEARRKKTVILHLSNFMDISSSLLRAITTLLAEDSSKSNPLLITIQGERGSWKDTSYHGEFFSKFRRWESFEELEFEPLEHDEIKAVFDCRFPNSNIPNDFYEDMKKLTGGIPRELYLVTSLLIHEKLLVEKLSGTWAIAENSEHYGKVFKEIEGSKCYLNYKAKIEDPQLMERIETFLEYAAVCGEYVPVYTVFEAMGVIEQKEKHQLSLKLDEYLGEDTDDPILEDLDVPEEFEPLYSNRPEELIYRFLKKWLITFFRPSRKRRKQIAKDLLPLYEKNSGAGRKAQCKLLYRLAELAEDAMRIEKFNFYLKIWHTASEIEQLKNQLEVDLRQSDLKIESLFNIFKSSEHTLPFSIRIALAQVLLEVRSNTIAYSDLDQIKRDLIGLLYESGAYFDVIDLCNSYPAPEEDSYLLSLRGLANKRLSYYEAALFDLKKALEITEATLRPDHPDLAFTMDNLAGLYKSQGKYEQAEPLYTRALKIIETVLGPDHPTTKIIKDNYEDLINKRKS